MTKARARRSKRAARGPKDFKTIGQLASHFFPLERSQQARSRGTARERGGKAADELLDRLGRSLRLDVPTAAEPNS